MNKQIYNNMGNQQKTTQLENGQAKKEEAKPQCGIIMPISTIEDCSASHWGEVKRILETAIKAAGYVPLLVSDANDSGVIQKRIVQNIYDNEIVVCDVSCKNPNVMFELGMRLAFDKPTIIVMDNKTNYSFDTAPIEHLIYPRDLSFFAILDFQEKLTDKIKGTIAASKDKDYTTFLKNFGEFKIATIEHTEGSLNEAVLAQLKDINNLLQVMRPDSSRIKLIEPYRLLESENTPNSNPTKVMVRSGIEEYCSKNNTNIYELQLRLIDNIDERAKLLRFVERYLDNRGMYVPIELIKELVTSIVENPFDR